MPYEGLVENKAPSKRFESGTPRVKELMSIVGKACNGNQNHSNLIREKYSLPGCYFFTIAHKQSDMVVPVGVITRSEKASVRGLEYWLMGHIAQGIAPMTFFTKSGKFYNNGRHSRIKRDWKSNLLLLELLSYKSLDLEKSFVNFINYNERKVEVMGVSYHSGEKHKGVGFHPRMSDNFYEISIPYSQGIYMPQLSSLKDEREYPHKFGFKNKEFGLKENLELFSD